MGKKGFWIGISRGDDLLHVHIFKKGRYVHARAEVQEGFHDMEVSQYG